MTPFCFLLVGAGASTLADNYNGTLENRSLSYPDENKPSGENINLFARSFSNDQGMFDYSESLL